MNVIPFNRARALGQASGTPEALGARPRKGCVALLLAATLATGTAFAAEQVESDDTVARAPAAPEAPAKAAAAPAPAKPASGSTQSERDRELDARLREAKHRLEEAAGEVAALSSEIAKSAMQRFSVAGSGLVGGPRRSIVGVVLEAPESGPGARVRDVSPGGAAETAGIKVGDVIVAVNGTALKDGAREAARLLRQVQPDTKVQLRVTREGKARDFTVTARPLDSRALANRSGPQGDFDFDFDFGFDPSNMPFGPFGQSSVSGGLGGMELTSLTPQLARYFGTDKGLLVVRAPKDDIYKLQDGDVILSIDGRVPMNGSHVTRILRSYQPGETFTMHIMRDRKPLDLQVALPEPSRTRRTRAAWRFDDFAII